MNSYNICLPTWAHASISGSLLFFFISLVLLSSLFPFSTHQTPMHIRSVWYRLHTVNCLSFELFPLFLKTALPPSPAVTLLLPSHPLVWLLSRLLGFARCTSGGCPLSWPTRPPCIATTYIHWQPFLFHLIVFGISTHVFCVKTYPEPYSSFGSIYSRRVSGGKGGTSGKAEASSSTLRVFSLFFLTSWKYQENGFKNYAFFPTKKIFLLWKFGHFFNEL